MHGKKVLFWGQIFETDVLMNAKVLRAPESESDVFCSWPVSMCLLSLT